MINSSPKQRHLNQFAVKLKRSCAVLPCQPIPLGHCQQAIAFGFGFATYAAWLDADTDADRYWVRRHAIDRLNDLLVKADAARISLAIDLMVDAFEEAGL